MKLVRIIIINILLCLHIYHSLSEKQNDTAITDSSEGYLESPLCCNLTVEEVEVDYSSKIVENEYIVMFNGYYKNQARAGYINTALNGTGVKKWSIVERENPASDYPSDFDVVILEDTNKLEGRLKTLYHYSCVYLEDSRVKCIK